MCLVVSDVGAAGNEPVAGGVEAGEVCHEGAPGARLHQDGTSGRASGPAPGGVSYGWFVSFSGPDGNSWLFREVTTRPRRVDHPATSFASLSDLAGATRRASAAHGQRETRTSALPRRDHARGDQGDRWSGHRTGGGVPSAVAPSSALHPDVR